MDEESIKREARLQAIEFLLGRLYMRDFMRFPDPLAEVNRGMESMLSGLNQAVIPGIDPALSDLATAEMKDAIEHLLVMIREMVETESRPGE